MWNSSYRDTNIGEYYKLRKQCKVLGIITLIFIISAILALVLGYYGAGSIALLIIAQIFMHIFSAFLSVYKEYRNAQRYIGLNQMHRVDKEGFKVYDKVENTEMEYIYRWKDIYQIERFMLHGLKDEKAEMLVIIYDKAEFYKGINRRDKTLDKISKRKQKLSGGCFVICSKREYVDIKEHYNREIV